MARIGIRSERDFAAVIGHPVSHSLSPVIFDYLAKKSNLPLSYGRLDLLPSELPGALEIFKRNGFFRGVNVTIPHKETAAKLADRISPEAKLMGAANVLKFSQGKIEAYNTDIYGIAQTLKEQRCKVAGKDVILFGAGGAAKAVAYVLGSQGARCVSVVNRDRARARRLCMTMGKQFKKTRFETVDVHRLPTTTLCLYVNATALGMNGFPEFDFLPQKVTSGALAFDLVYRPHNTSFLKQARARGLRTVGGLDMLVWQALKTWELWFGATSDQLSSLKPGLKRRLAAHLARGC